MNADWKSIETAPKEEVLILWFPEFSVFTACAWIGVFCFTTNLWEIRTPFNFDGKQVTVSYIPQPTHWMLIPRNP